VHYIIYIIHSVLAVVPDDDHGNPIPDGDEMHPPHSPTPPESPAHAPPSQSPPSSPRLSPRPMRDFDVHGALLDDKVHYTHNYITYINYIH
jgi:hypothetical protein